MKFKKSLILGPLILFIGFLNSTQARPLTDEQIKSARKILIMPGTYDPFSLGHLETAELTLRAVNADLVIILPTGSPLVKRPLPFETRVQMLETVLERHPSLAYPTGLVWRKLAKSFNPFNSFAARIRELNPRAEIDLVVGQDVAEDNLSFVLRFTHPDQTFVVPRDSEKSYQLPKNLVYRNVHLLPDGPSGISSSKARSFLHENLDLYFADRSSPEFKAKFAELSKLLDPATIDLILNRGLYLDTQVDNHMTPMSGVKNWASRKAVTILKSLHLFEEVKSIAVKRVRNNTLDEIVIGDKHFEVQKYLGSGLGADVYLINVNGIDVAIKIARDDKGREVNKRTINVQKWAQTKFQIRSPELLAFDPEGNWIMSEFIKGQSLPASIVENGGLDSRTRDSILDLHARALEMSKLSLINLDIAPDNIIIRDGEAYLVDLGPIPVGSKMDQDGRVMLELWEIKYKHRNSNVFVNDKSFNSGAKTCSSLFL